MPAGKAAWLAIFHAVSAFNNAGFALFADSLERFATDPWICLPICTAVILGGLGFPVLMQLRRSLLGRAGWSLNTRLVLCTTAVLLVAGTIGITALEWNDPGTLGGLDPGSRVLAGFFQAVQTRTAGFDSIDIGALRSSTLLGMSVLMFIGGGSAGTAGGIKVTTFSVLLLALIAEVRGGRDVNAFGRRVPDAVIRQAVAVVLLAIAAVVAGTIALLLTTPFDLSASLFEAVSAFGTVGLSTGITPQLGSAGKVAVILLMFIGRLGPTTFASALALSQRPVHFQLPKERPIIG
jgi:Trk-type K+ transport system membrane component